MKITDINSNKLSEGLGRFMFAAVMMDAENCRCFLERVLEIAIERVEISTEHGFFFNLESKSIRILAGSEADYEDPFVEQLQNSMRRIKNSRRMGERYMMFEQYMQEYVQEHADEIREEARAEGLEQGRTEGREQGLEEGMTRLNKLNSCLLSANRLSDLQRALQDPEYQKKLLQEFGI